MSSSGFESDFEIINRGQEDSQIVQETPALDIHRLDQKQTTMKTPHLTTLEKPQTPQPAENFRTLLTNANPASSYMPTNSRDEILVKCKKAIENLHFELEK